jgi:hypothetical protein
MKSVLLLSLVFLLSSALVSFAQQQDAFKPNGKPEVRIFTNVGSTFSDGENFNKFDVTRAYFGYIHNFSKNWTGRVTFDVGKPSVGNFHYTGFLKFAYMQYHTDKFTLTGGLISTPQYEIGDKRWGYRYIYKTSHDEYGFGPSADFGISAVYNLSEKISLDALLVNGESFRTQETDSAFKAGIGITVYPVKNLLLRGYYDIMPKDGKKQQTLEYILSYEDKVFNLTAIYNFQKDRNYISGQNISGLSFNGSLFLKNNHKLIARYDHLYSDKIGSASNPWNFAKDGSLIIAGFEFSPVSGIKIAPNIQNWQPADENRPSVFRFMLNAEIRL